MKVVAINKLTEAQSKYPAAQDYLKGWYQIVSRGDFSSEEDLRATFGDMRGFNVAFRFPIPKTTLLVHTLIDFKAQVALIEDIKPGNH
ncbi:type II toxin-antitoxin system HigB family toxin [Aliikangiella sp. G2MR2-5]|uniref:type II toxin-antitoxin system HigB family toxin n=1 Tax=Aliikangiella sp. G2MR2-5 TaxID=2788943 RepID=UPI0018AA803C|nr:type II toxin-antitoxin system HigB family toxin [Aliikangiella sp. G2MR2-5]